MVMAVYFPPFLKYLMVNKFSPVTLPLVRR